MFWNTKQSWRKGTKLKVFALFVLLVYLVSFFMRVTENCQIFFYRLLSVISLEPCEFLKISTSDYARVIQVTLNIILKHSIMACCLS